MKLSSSEVGKYIVQFAENVSLKQREQSKSDYYNMFLIIRAAESESTLQKIKKETEDANQVSPPRIKTSNSVEDTSLEAVKSN